MILLLAGTREAREIAAALAIEGIEAEVSLAGATEKPAPLPLPMRVGGFGGEAGFAEYLRSRHVHGVIDATHPFASRMRERSARIAQALGVPYMRVDRPGWTADRGDHWTWIDAEEEADERLPQGATVFLATGRQGFGRYGPLTGRRVLCRQIDPPTEPLPFDTGEFVLARPPFTRVSEESLFRALSVDILVAKDAGGEPGRTKLDAARALGIPVLMIRRPELPPAPTVMKGAEAIVWARGL